MTAGGRTRTGIDGATAGNRRGKGAEGFTLIEIIIVGVVLGILAGIAIPVYYSFLKRARQVEAPVALNEIKRLESMYYAYSGSYGSLDEIGYHPNPPLRYYQVSLELTPPGADSPTGFKAAATGNIDSDDEADVWTIVENGTPVHLLAD